jgi:hypothetical protein
MSAKKAGDIKPKNFELYRELMNSLPGVEVKGATMPYTSLNGNMFSFLSKEGLVGIRLPEDQREGFLKKYKTTLFEAHGTILKEYVTVPEALLKKGKELGPFLKESLKYAKTLKAKPKKK